MEKDGKETHILKVNNDQKRKTELFSSQGKLCGLGLHGRPRPRTGGLTEGSVACSLWKSRLISRLRPSIRE